jgi:CheY-like chemotaxis protein
MMAVLEPEDCYRVLVVEDEDDHRGLVEEILRATGYRVLVATDGQEALDACTNEPPDVIVLDIRMPVMDGRAFLDALWSRNETVTTPVIVMTGDPSYAPPGLRCIRKPCDPNVLRRMIAEVLAESTQSGLSDDLIARRPLAVFAVLTVIAAFVLLSVGILEILTPRTPPKIAPAPPVLPALTSHLVIVVVDGLRFDFATDPARAKVFARHMGEDAHAEVRAGKVTMTSAAIFTFGAAQRADFAEAITNLNARRPPHNTLFENARVAGLRTALVGDDTWKAMFGAFDVERIDHEGGRSEQENAESVFGAAAEALVEEPRPALAVVHFMASDHMGHAHGTSSAAYREFLAWMDGRLGSMVETLPRDTTVFVLSDHGATDTGAHGPDIAFVRRTPMFATGPGIRRGVDAGVIDQVDLASTWAALLGISSPAHGRGLPAIALLDLSPAAKATLVCSEARRSAALAHASGNEGFEQRVKGAAAGCDEPSAAPETLIAAGSAAVRAYDAYLDAAESRASVRGLAIALFVALLLFSSLSLAVPGDLLGGRRARAGFVLAAFLVSVACVVLTYGVERIQPPFHNVARAVLFVAANGALLLVAVRRTALDALFDRAAPVALALLIGVLPFSYPANTQPEALALSLVMAVAVQRMLGGKLRAPFSVAPSLALVLGLALLLPFGIRQDDPLVKLLGEQPIAMRVAGAVLPALATGLLAFTRQPTVRPVEILAGAAIAGSAVIVRSNVSPAVGLALLATSPIAAILSARSGRVTLATGIGFFAYAMVSRDVEVPGVAGAMLVGESLFHRAAPHADEESAPRWTPALLGLSLFAVLFLLRVALQRGLDFPLMDWTAGAFGNPSPPYLRTAILLGWKYVSAGVLVGWLMLRALPPRAAEGALFYGVAAEIGRSATMAAMLIACISSYWTALRTMSELPAALIFSVVGAVGLLARLWAERRRASAMENASGAA